MIASEVYFIQCGPGGPVKIGVTTDAPLKRLNQLQTGNPVKLYLIGTVPGGKEIERELHRRFAAGRLEGEWFDIETPGLRYALRHLFEHGELPETPVVIGDSFVRGCPGCGWQVERELLERGEVRCWSCLKDGSQVVPVEPDREGENPQC